MIDIAIIGAGLTGLTAALQLQQAGYSVQILERAQRIGGVIQSHHEAGFTFEQGPSTGVIGNAELAELLLQFPELKQIADPSAARRLILKTHKGKQSLFPLPSGPKSGLQTPLFSFRDKLRLLTEPFRAAGSNPNEPLAELVRRRLGRDFLRYAVDPFIGGIYAGDPERLITRFALPKLYALEQNYGSFIRGAIAKRKEPKSDRDRLATREVFSVHGGLQQLVSTLGEALGEEALILGAESCQIAPEGDHWIIRYTRDGQLQQLEARQVISTAPAYELPTLLPFLSEAELTPITALRYAPIVQVAWGVEQALPQFHAFGGLFPSSEDNKVLGILNPGACFPDRVPHTGASMLSIFLGGMRAPEVIDYSDEEIRQLVTERLERILGVTTPPRVFHIFRHRYAIPQYEAGSEERLEQIQRLEAQYPGLHLAGAIRDGIGMADRVKQAALITDSIIRSSHGAQC